MELPSDVAQWFARRGWRLRRHQAEMLEAAGEHRLLVAATGAGKTLAGFLPTLAGLIARPAEGLHTLYVSPLKALVVDVRRNLLIPVEEMGLPIRIETRTGDTPNERKTRQRERPPQILLTTPESLSLLLSYEDAPALFGGLHTVILDEVHAFATSKRGDLTALALARLQALAPPMRRVALSATVDDPDAYRSWLAPGGDTDAVRLIHGEPGAPPRARAGEAFTITHRGTAIAKLVPIEARDRTATRETFARLRRRAAARRDDPVTGLEILSWRDEGRR